MSACSLQFTDEELETDNLERVSHQLISAFSTSGFAYVSNSAIPETLLERVRSTAKEFFHLPTDAKDKYRLAEGKINGYSGLEMEKFANQERGDYKEAFDFNLENIKNQLNWPDEDVPGFSRTVAEFFEKASRLAERLLLLIGYGLKLDSSTFLKQCHNLTTCQLPYSSLMRFLYYPPLPENLEEGTVRLGEHTDYGTITLLFQDEVGGLQVRRNDGVLVDAIPIPGTVLVNIGDLLQRWTNDRLVSTPHRISHSELKSRERQSIAFFVHPDPNIEIVCLDPLGRYEPVLAGKYYKSRNDEAYNYR